MYAHTVLMSTQLDSDINTQFVSYAACDLFALCAHESSTHFQGIIRLTCQ